MARDYRQEYDSFHGKPEQIKKRAMRVQARRDMEKKVGAQALAGKDIDHKKPLRNGGSNGPGNLRISSVKSNRSKNGK